MDNSTPNKKGDDKWPENEYMRKRVARVRESSEKSYHIKVNNEF